MLLAQQVLPAPRDQQAQQDRPVRLGQLDQRDQPARLDQSARKARQASKEFPEKTVTTVLQV